MRFSRAAAASSVGSSCYSIPTTRTHSQYPYSVDVWSGDDGSPVITHGRTLTSKIPARDALAAIAQYAFLASAFPVILSIEIHCDTAQQDRLATIFRETLGDKLLDRRIDDGTGEIEQLPSPWQLRGKILLKVSFILSLRLSGD